MELAKSPKKLKPLRVGQDCVLNTMTAATNNGVLLKAVLNHKFTSTRRKQVNLGNAKFNLSRVVLVLRSSPDRFWDRC